MSINKQITSTVTDQGKLEIAIIESKRPAPKDDEVLIQVEATPINPSDLGLLLGPGDINTLEAKDSKIIMDVPKAKLENTILGTFVIVHPKMKPIIRQALALLLIFLVLCSNRRHER